MHSDTVNEPKPNLKLLLLSSALISCGVAGYFIYPHLSESFVSSYSGSSLASASSSFPTAAISDDSTSQLPKDAGEIFLGPQFQTISTESAFDYEQWKSQFADKTKHQEKHPNWPHPYSGGKGFSWWQPQEADCAARWKTPLGPLGIMANPINKSWQKHKGFDMFYPDNLNNS